MPSSMIDKLSIIPFSELMKGSPAIDWAIEGIAPDIGMGFLAGKFSVGKSWISQSLILSLATGKKWLGHFGVKQGKVLVLDEENAQPLLTNRFHKLTKGMGIRDYNLPIFYSIKSRMNFSNDARGKPSQMYDLLWEWAQKNRPTVIVADSLTRVHRNNEDKSYEMAPVFLNVDKLCQEFKCMTIFTHHSGHAGDRMRGSVDLYGASEWSLFINKTGKPPSEKITVSQDRARWDEAIKPFSVTLKGSEHSFRVLYAGEGRQSDTLDESCRAILKALKAKPLEHSQVWSKANISQATFYRNKDFMIEQGWLTETRQGKRKILSLAEQNGKAD